MSDARPARDHVVVFGFHGLARRVVQQLAAAGEQVLVVDPEASDVAQEAFRRWGVHYLRGSGRSRETLEEAGVTAAKAVVCVKDDDVRNIESALLVRELSATVRIVVQVANVAVGRALHAVATPGAVIDVAGLASASFVEAAVSRATHAVDLGGQRYLVATVPCDTTGTIADVHPTLATVAVRPAGSEALVACPSPDLLIGPGDVLTLIGTEAEYAAAGLVPERGAPVHQRRLRTRLREGAAAVSDAVDRPFRIAFAILAVLVGMSIVILATGYRSADGARMSVLDAVYFTAETIATVGFGDFYFRGQEPALRVWAIVLVLMGATLVTVVTALLTNALVSRRLEASLGRQRLTHMSDHIVVVGLGAVGGRVATDLRTAGYEVAVIDGGEGTRFIPRMQAIGVPVLIGDATLPDTQLAAGVHRAAGVAILTSDDLLNIETGLAVRGVVGDRAVPITLRIYSHSLARGLSGLGIGLARSPAELAAPWFAGAALGMEVLATFYVGSTPFMAARLPAARVEAAAGEGVLEVARAEDGAYLIGPYEHLIAALTRP